MTHPGRKHFLLLNFPAFGHMIPLLELGKKLKANGHDVTAVISSSFIPGLQSRSLIPSTSEMDVYPLDDGVPSSLDQMSNFAGFDRVIEVIKLVFPVLEKFLRSLPTKNSKPGECDITLPVDVIITDRFYTDIAVVCVQRDIPLYVFNASSGPHFARQRLDHSQSSQDKKWSPPGVDASKNFGGALNRWFHLVTGNIFNVFRELDPANYADIENHPMIKDNHIRIRCVGPLFPPETGIENGNAGLKQWLDNHEDRSVLYVSFGTVVKFPQGQVEEVSRALMQTGRPYVWALKAQMIPFLPEDVLETLKKDNAERRYWILPWVSQKEILSHPAVRIFVTHAGWNSTLEGISCGVPMLAWPGFADQHDNAAWIAKNQLGVFLPDTKYSSDARIIAAEEIAAALESMENSYESFLNNAKKWSRLAKNAALEGGSSWKDTLALTDS